MIENIVTNTKLIEAVSKYKTGFILLMLVLGNIYQFIDCNRRIDNNNKQANAEIYRLNEVIRQENEKALDYEKERGARYEFLLNNLPKITTQNNTKDANH